MKPIQVAAVAFSLAFFALTFFVGTAGAAPDPRDQLAYELMAVLPDGGASPLVHMTAEQCFLASLPDAGNPAAQVTRDALSAATEIQNQGSTTLWCAVANQSDAVVNHSRSIGAGGGTWTIQASGKLAIWCLAQTVDQQTLRADGGTADGGPAGCAIISNLH